MPDGTVMRDSDPPKPRPKPTKRKLAKKVTAHARIPSVVEHPVARAIPKEWVESWQRSCGPAQTTRRPVVTSQTMARRTRLSINARQEAAFMEWWRESRNHSLQPRSSDAPTAAQRLEALRSRVLARQGANSA